MSTVLTCMHEYCVCMSAVSVCIYIVLYQYLFMSPVSVCIYEYCISMCVCILYAGFLNKSLGLDLGLVPDANFKGLVLVLVLTLFLKINCLGLVLILAKMSWS